MAHKKMVQSMILHRDKLPHIMFFVGSMQVHSGELVTFSQLQKSTARVANHVWGTKTWNSIWTTIGIPKAAVRFLTSSKEWFLACDGMAMNLPVS